MTFLQRYITEPWEKISHIGIGECTFSEARKVTLSNQVAFLGTVIPQFYNIFYWYYDFNLLYPLIIINVIGSSICLSVLFLNHFQKHMLAKIVISVFPNIQIFLLTYYLSTASGMHLLHIMMISFIFLLFLNERKSVIALFTLLPLILYIISFVKFDPVTSPIILDADVLKVFYIFISITVFLLLMMFFGLFHREIHITETLLQNEYERSENLLLNILPLDVASRLKNEPGFMAEQFSEVTILFADIVGFTHISSDVSPTALVTSLNDIFSRFDKMADYYRLEKIKTIGDAYMVAGGIPTPMENHTEAMAHLALDMLDEIAEMDFEGNHLAIRIGFHTGPVVAGVIGKRKFSYDIWGEAVNLASRLESHGEQMKIHVSREVYEKLKDHFIFEARGTIPVKGVGELETYFLNGQRTVH